MNTRLKNALESAREQVSMYRFNQRYRFDQNQADSKVTTSTTANTQLMELDQQDFQQQQLALQSMLRYQNCGRSRVPQT